MWRIIQNTVPVNFLFCKFSVLGQVKKLTRYWISRSKLNLVFGGVLPHVRRETVEEEALE